jgi:inosose dehydratase
VSWGVEAADDPRNPGWETFLDEVAAAGYEGTELGVLGYLPEDPDLLAEALTRRGLRLVAGYVHCPASGGRAFDEALVATRRACRTLKGLGAAQLVIIDERPDERLATAGNSAEARRLEEDQFQRLMRSIAALAETARDDYGVDAVLHHHAAGYIEFRDEIDRAVEALACAGVGLCLDTGHAAYAGIDPAELYEAYSDRIGYMHLKDVDPHVRERAIHRGLDFWTAVRAGIFCPVGQGVVDFASLHGALVRHRYCGWATVEQDRDPAEAATAVDRARLSREYLVLAGIARSA